MWIWIAAVILSGFGLMVGIELLMIRLGIRPADPAQKSGGLRDIAEKLNRWAGDRRTHR